MMPVNPQPKKYKYEFGFFEELRKYLQMKKKAVAAIAIEM